MTEPTLLERAKQVKVRSRSKSMSAEEVDLACAWARDEVSRSAVGRVLGKRSNSLYTFLALGLRDAVRKGRLIEQTNGHAAHGGPR